MNAVDVRTSIERLLGTVESVMQRAVVLLRPEETIGEAIRRLEEAGVSGGPVMDGPLIVGVVSMRDLFETAEVDPKRAATSGPWRRFERAADASGKQVRDAMERSVVKLLPDASIAEAARAMRDHKVNRIPIVDLDGVLIGIVARDDVIEAVARAALKLHSPGASMPPD